MIVALLLAATITLQEPGKPDRFFLELVPTTSTTSSSTSSTAPPPSTSTSSSSTTSTTLQVGGLAFYVAVTGSDTTGDGRRVNPFRTANKALTIAKAGDSVLLLNNVDSQPHAPITITNRTNLTVGCETEGQCSIITTGQTAVAIRGSTKIGLLGVALKTADNASVGGSTVLVEDSSRVTIRRNLVWRNNRHWNAHPIQLVRVADSEVVENACLEHSRHCISLHQSNGNYVARNWIDNMGRVQLLSSPPGGKSRESIAVYPGSRNLIANNLIEGKEGWGINFNASGTEEDNVSVGNIVAGTFLGGKVYSRPGGVAVRSIIRDFVTTRVGPSLDLRDQVTVGSLYERITAFGGTAGVEVDNPAGDAAQLSCTQISGTPSVTIRDSVLSALRVEACTGKTRGCSVTNTIVPSRTLMAGCVTSGLGSTLPPDLGDSGAGKCLVKLAGAQGADVRCVIGPDGTKTATPLWDAATGQFRFCPPVRAGWPSGCQDYAARRLNHRPWGCPLDRLICS